MKGDREEGCSRGSSPRRGCGALGAFLEHLGFQLIGGGVGVGAMVAALQEGRNMGANDLLVLLAERGRPGRAGPMDGVVSCGFDAGTRARRPSLPAPGPPGAGPQVPALVLWFPDLRPCIRGPASARLLPDQPPGPSVARDGLPFLGRGLRTQPLLKPHLEGLRVTKARCRRHLLPTKPWISPHPSLELQ